MSYPVVGSDALARKINFRSGNVGVLDALFVISSDNGGHCFESSCVRSTGSASRKLRPRMHMSTKVKALDKMS